MILSLATAVASILLMASGLRLMARDLLQVVAGAAQRAQMSGQLPARAAFLLLWVMIFVLSYM